MTQRCTCGYTRFRETRAPANSARTAWVNVTSGAAGLGITPLGVSGGGAPGSGWELVPYTYYSEGVSLVCENCGRRRTSQTTVGFGIIGARVVENGIFLLGEGNLSNVRISFTLGGRTYVATPQLSAFLGSWTTFTPSTSTSPTPLGATSTVVMFYRYPEVIDAGAYTVQLQSLIPAVSVGLGTVNLEPYSMFIPEVADISPAHRDWIFLDSRLDEVLGQPQGVTGAIPFDKCDAVVVYNAKEGLPTAQGWTAGGTVTLPPWSMTANNEELLYSSSVVQNTYWERAVPLASAPTSVYLSVAAKPQSEASGYAGYVRALAAAELYPYIGPNLAYDHNRVYAITNTGSYATPLEPRSVPDWSQLAAGASSGLESYWGAGSQSAAPGDLFGTGAVASASELRVRFGSDVVGVMWWRSLIASVGGRYVVARFSAYTPVTAPTLHLYMRADNGSSTSRTARFRLKYRSDAYSGQVEQTLTFPTPYTQVVTPVTLSGLPSGRFTWSLERVWDHADDLLRETVRLDFARLSG